MDNATAINHAAHEKKIQEKILIERLMDEFTKKHTVDPNDRYLVREALRFAYKSILKTIDDRMDQIEDVEIKDLISGIYYGNKKFRLVSAEEMFKSKP